MKRLSTPTHRFPTHLGEDVLREIKSVMITYSQDGIKVLDKVGAAVTIDGNVFVTNLTQEETKKFTEGRDVEMQIRILLNSGNSYPSNIMVTDCERVLNDEVMV